MIKIKIYKAVLFIIATMLCFSVLYGETIAQSPSNYNESGAGLSIDNPYFISSLGNLRWLSETESSWGTLNNKFFYQQTADIDATETLFWYDGAGFLPIGWGWDEDYVDCFHSHYNGSGFVISNLYIYRPEEDGVGLFRRVDRANISNVILENVNITGFDWVGAIAGTLEPLGYPILPTSLTNSSATGKVKGNMNIGGLLGRSSAHITEVFNCFADVEVIGNIQVGGLIGLTGQMTISNSYAIGNVNGKQYVGGLLGLGLGGIVIPTYETFVIVENSYATGRVNGEDSVGGLVGYCWAGIINTSYATGKVTGLEYVGGLVGTLARFTIDGTGGTPSFLNNSVYDLQTTGINDPVGFQDINTFINNSTGKSTVEMKMQSTYTDLGWDFENIWIIDPTINEGYPFFREPIVNDKDIVVLQKSFDLFQNFPNPFNPTTVIAFENAVDGNISIDIFNIRGQRVRSLVNEHFRAGSHSVEWNGLDENGRAVSSGIYFYQMRAGDFSEVKRMVLMK